MEDNASKDSVIQLGAGFCAGECCGEDVVDDDDLETTTLLLPPPPPSIFDL
eukprot:CAMPEP_0196136002 /NCGR_PEP_ID=MMETSP0910-20130528/4452_1 /TAXON_ID=49265 /ORGANISM="Thalassiosira rotula, Strain GSO102" /LENGTH=50 /DNA_ID=CAMNT_0041396211 /DNA_START=234 /DNA_END=386 /DNA_ORIENTATION=-